MQPIARLGLLLLMLAASAYAAGPVPLKLDDLGGKRILKPSQAVDIALAEADREWVDTWVDRDRRERAILTGPTWAKAFKGDPHSAAVFSIKTTSVKEESSGGGFGHRVTYTVEGVVSIGGRDYPIQAHGAESSGRDAMHAFPSAAEKCMVDAARRAAAIVADDAAQSH